MQSLIFQWIMLIGYVNSWYVYDWSLVLFAYTNELLLPSVKGFLFDELIISERHNFS